MGEDVLLGCVRRAHHDMFCLAAITGRSDAMMTRYRFSNAGLEHYQVQVLYGGGLTFAAKEDGPV